MVESEPESATDTKSVQLSAVEPRALSPAQLRQRSLAPAKHGGRSRDPRCLFALSTVRSRVRVLFENTPGLSEWEGDGDGPQRRVPIERLRPAVRRYVIQAMIWDRMAAQFIAEGDLNASLGDRLRQWAAKLEAAEQALGIVPERSRRGEGGDPWA